MTEAVFKPELLAQNSRTTWAEELVKNNRTRVEKLVKNKFNRTRAEELGKDSVTRAEELVKINKVPNVWEELSDWESNKQFKCCSGEAYNNPQPPRCKCIGHRPQKNNKQACDGTAADENASTPAAWHLSTHVMQCCDAEAVEARIKDRQRVVGTI